MRVNVDDKATADPRFQRLGARLRINKYEALGRCIPVWLFAYICRSSQMKDRDVDALAERNGFAKAMIEVDLAQRKGKGVVRLRGVDDRIEFLLVQDAKREKANAARKALSGYPREGPPGSNGGASRGRVPGQGPYSPDPVPVPSQDRSPDPIPEKRERALSTRGKRDGSLSPLPAGWMPPGGGKAEAVISERGDEIDAKRAIEKWRLVRSSDGKKSADWDADLAKWLFDEKPARRPGGNRKRKASKGWDLNPDEGQPVCPEGVPSGEWVTPHFNHQGWHLFVGRKYEDDIGDDALGKVLRETVVEGRRVLELEASKWE